MKKFGKSPKKVSKAAPVKRTSPEPVTDEETLCGCATEAPETKRVSETVCETETEVKEEEKEPALVK